MMKQVMNCKSTLAALAATMIISMAPVAGGVTADDVVCIGCVETVDLKNGSVGTFKLRDGAVTNAKIGEAAVSTSNLQNGAVGTLKLQDNAVGTLKLKDGAVGTPKLKNGAVSTIKLQNGAVTYPKLAPALRGIVDDAAAYDYRNYNGESADVTEKVWALTGDFGNCGGAGAPDTEVENFSRTDLGDGVTRVTSTRSRYAGGLSGTLCRQDITTYIADALGYKLVRDQRFAADGISMFADIVTEYDASSAPDAGLNLAGTNMVLGTDFQSAGLTINTVDSSSGAYVSKIVLTDFGLSETIDEGGGNEETLNDCIETNEMRTSTHLGVRNVIRRFCAGIGSVMRLQVESTGSYGRWSLVDYTRSP